ncbi:MAG TPA: succinate dehydrogenase, hydrophobic membrane anchor protein [Rhizomicrobium sp.]|nr:succinate dehydrogenase, hydrophobic membrane anchor protein [Rhizomicrobium sp.]
MSLETPLHRVEGLGSAHSGVTHFWRQRVTAAALIILGTWFAFSWFGLVGAHEAATLSFLSRPVNAILMASFIIIALYHMALGLQVVIDDYVHNDGQKLALMLLMRAFAIAVGAFSLFALLEIARVI